VHLEKTLNPIDWDDTWNNYQGAPSNTDNISSDFNHSFFMIQPRIGLSYAILDWLAVSTSVDVPLMNLNSNGWTLNGDDVYNAPSLDLTQPFFQFSILFGG
jgi:hypothetical protein